MKASGMRNSSERRAAFTLIELLVVMGILAILLGLGVLVAPAFSQNGADAAAEQLQGWLHIAKQRALRDKGPRGLRLIIDRTNPNHLVARSAQYIQAPNDFTGGQIRVSVNSQDATITGADLTGGLTSAALWPVQPGDFLQISNRELQRIVSITPTGPRAATVRLQSRQISPATTTNYRIIRQPRPINGEETLSFPGDTIVDLAVNSNGTWSYRSRYTASGAHPDGQGTHIDILFTPSGPLLGQSTRGKVSFWTRESITASLQENDQSLISVYSRTGLIAVHDVDVESGDPYSYTRDFRASGL